MALAAVLAGSWLAALPGCYHGSAHDTSMSTLVKRDGWQFVDGVRPIRQSAENDCGAAALAMVFDHWGVRVTPAEISGAYPREVGRGLAAGDLRDFARRRGLDAFLIAGEMPDLVREISGHHPVLVGLVQRQGDRGLAHYEVVAGINVAARRLYLLDPARGPREDGYDGFLTEWQAAGRVTLVVSGLAQRNATTAWISCVVSARR